VDIRLLIPDTLLRGAVRLLAVRRKLVFTINVDQLRHCRPKIPAVYRLGSRADLASFSLNFYGDDPASAQYSIERLGAGDQLVVAELDGQTVFSGWLMFGQIDMGVRNFYPLGAGSAASYRLFTRETLRGNNLSAAYFSFLKQYLPGKGTTRIVSWVEGRNAGSRRAHESAGFRQAGVVWHVRILGKSLFWLSAATKAILLGTEADQAQSGLTETEAETT
jgi:GNAT superfamily N-acetyltransferase